MTNLNLYLSCDKGNKKGNKNLAKFFCWYDKIQTQVCTYLLDVNCVDEDTSDIFPGIKHSIERFFSTLDHPIPDIKLRGQCTDSGGGGTLFVLANEMKKKISKQYIPHFILHTTQCPNRFTKC